VKNTPRTDAIEDTHNERLSVERQGNVSWTDLEEAYDYARLLECELAEMWKEYQKLSALVTSQGIALMECKHGHELKEAGRRLLDYIDDDEISPEDSAKLLAEMKNIFKNENL